ncbi:MAG: sugar ABC transporter ATP-binding protein [Propioniciclava sp.]
MSVQTTDQPMLSIRGVRMQFPGTLALESVDLDIYPGEVVALLGENGAGKSTLAKIIAGVQKPTSGTLEWQGAPFTPGSPAEAFNAGVGMIHQEMQLVPELSVAENVYFGRWPTRNGLVDRAAMEAGSQTKLQQLGFSQPVSTLVRELSVAGQQQVEIARALVVNSKLVILDEPTAALGGEETEALFDRVRELQQEGVSFIYVSHRLAEIAQIATRIVVLRDGTLVATHDSASVSTDQLVAEMVGRAVDRLFPELSTPSETEVISVRQVTAENGQVKPISFEVRGGEIFGIAGLVGAGRTELVRAIAGADPSSTGVVQVLGSTVRPHSVPAAVRAGIVMVPESRKEQGVIVSESIEENIALPNLDLVSDASGFVTGVKIRGLSDGAIDAMGVKGKPAALVSSLSGGNQQKVVIGKWLERKPRVVILDEPTRGIDVGARAAIYDVIVGLAADDVAVILVSSDLEEVLGLSHRVMVLSRGESRGVLERAEATPEAVMTLATH